VEPVLLERWFDICSILIDEASYMWSLEPISLFPQYLVYNDILNGNHISLSCSHIGLQTCDEELIWHQH